MIRYRMAIFSSVFLLALLGVTAVSACGGLFCRNVPVDQQAERIIFAINDDSTVSAYVQINYTGDAPDFSWVVPVPSVPEVDVAEMSSFNELSNLTAPTFIPPLMPGCAPVPMPASAPMEESVRSDGEVTVLASGTAGPYAFDVVTSPDPNALILWLRDNDYRITEPMEPLVHVYSDEGMAFLAMKLQPEQGAQDIQPVKMTYEAERPTIPIRLTAVAANPNMSILTWIFASEQTAPVNFASRRLRMTIFAATSAALTARTISTWSIRLLICTKGAPLSRNMPSQPVNSSVWGCRTSWSSTWHTVTIM